jgi:hypothetical protein
MRHTPEMGLPNNQRTPNLAKVYENSRYINQDLWDIETLLERIAWTRDLRVGDKIDDGLWSRFTALDIDLFHVTIRSMFDYAATLLAFISGKPGQLPMVNGRASFEELYTWARKPGSIERVSPDFISAITDCEWFTLLRNVRNSIVHMGGQTVMMYIKRRIVFQTMQGHDNGFLVRFPEVMYNAHVVDFELYAGMIYGYLLNFLEDVGTLVFDWASASPEDRSERSTNQHSGMIAGKGWIEAARKQVALNPQT